MATILPIIQIILSVLLVVAILLQSRSAGIGALGGSEDTGTSFATRRGFEKFLFTGTIVIAILFIIVSVLSFIFA